MTLSEKEVEHIAHLARLELSPEEKALFTKQLADILNYAEKLNELDTSQVTPTSHAIPMETVFRDDSTELIKDEERNAILNNAPERSENFFVVPRILEEEI